VQAGAEVGAVGTSEWKDQQCFQSMGKAQLPGCNHQPGVPGDWGCDKRGGGRKGRESAGEVVMDVSAVLLNKKWGSSVEHHCVCPSTRPSLYANMWLTSRCACQVISRAHASPMYRHSLNCPHTL
jgi:hypothetical protein